MANSPAKPKRPCHICGGVDGEHIYEMHREGFAATAANPSSKEVGPGLDQ